MKEDTEHENNYKYFIRYCSACISSYTDKQQPKQSQKSCTRSYSSFD